MWLDHKPVLHIVDTLNGLQDAIFIKDGLAENLWNDFVNCWVSLYTTFTNFTVIDLEKQTLLNVFQIQC